MKQNAREFFIYKVKRRIIIFIGVLLMALVSNAQESLNAAGGDIETSSGSVSYSVGQIFFGNNENEMGHVAEGVQIPYEIFLITSVDEIKGISLNYNVFPNPVKDQLTLSLDYLESGNMAFQLLDLNGRIVKSENIIQRNTLIDMSQVNPAVYFLHVILNKQVVKTFRVIKR